MDDSRTGTPTRSTFVTVVAWVFIALAGLATLITALQNVIVFATIGLDELRSGAVEDAAFQAMPAWSRFLMTHVELWFLFCFAVSATTLVAAVGLLRRRNWARTLFVGILVFGVLWNVVAPLAGAQMMPTGEFGGADEDFARMLVLIQVFTAVIGLGMAGVFAWMAWRLCSPAVRAEFQRQ